MKQMPVTILMDFTSMQYWILHIYAIYTGISFANEDQNYFLSENQIMNFLKDINNVLQ